MRGHRIQNKRRKKLI